MTDPLSGRQLIERSYEYVDRLTKECARVLAQEFNASHRKFEPNRIGQEVGEAVLQWFAKRDRNVSLTLDPSLQHQPNVLRLKFNGSTKDAQFSIGATVATFSIPGANGSPKSYVKTVAFSVDKTNFAKPK